MTVPKSLTQEYFDDLDDAGFRIDLDFGDMAAVGIGRGAGAVADMGDVERLRRVGRRLRAVVQLLRQIHDRDRAVGADDGEVAVLEGDVGRRGFERVRRQLLALLDDFHRGFDDRGAGMHDRFRAAGAAAHGELVAVALQQRDFLERNAEPVAQDLRERRGMAHAEIERAGRQRHGAVGD